VSKRRHRKSFNLDNLKTSGEKIFSSEHLKSGDFWLLAVVLGLVVFRVIMVFSASYYQTINNNMSPYYYLIKDLFFAGTGFVLMMAAASMDYHKWKKAAPWIFLISIFLLILVLLPIPGLTNTSHGATRWIQVGPVTFMPGEFAKLSAILIVAWFLGDDSKKILSLKHGILPLVGLCVLYGGLIMMQPNMSTAITVCGIIVLMMFIAGIQWRWLIACGAMGAVGVAALIFTDEDGYRLKRVTSFTDPFADALGDGFQVVQSLLALGSGGLLGVGLGKSVQKNLYLPEPQNDFILAIIGEELGFVGIMALMALYLLLIWRGIHIAINAPDQFGLLVASGIVLLITVQVLLNVAVVTSSMPPTGVILPFISYGGNALMMFMSSIGILLNISRHTVDVK
jgi:cell division protein FtsW